VLRRNKDMYKVYSKGRKNAKWREYSREFDTMLEAENCKKIAEDRNTCDIHGNIVVYKIESVV
jgi:hypothetical protein